MLRLSWSRSALHYLVTNEGQVNNLELAFANFRLSQNGIPETGVLVEISYDIYIWKIHGHFVKLRRIPDSEKLHMRVEVIRPEITQTKNAL